MKKALIIGINGFAGSYLRKELERSYDVYGADIASFDDKVTAIDMLDEKACDALFEQVKPDYVFNLAGQASPNISWEKINLTMHLNVDLSVNIVMACLKHCPNARILLIGSSNQYDISKCQNSEGLLDEKTPLINDSPYAVSKNTQEAMIKLLCSKYNIDVIFTRSFNHIGRGQRKGFVVTDYCSRIASLENGEIDTFKFGNLDSWRDFSDARDVVHAYRLLAEKGQALETYNVGSGRSYYIRDMVGALIEKSELAMKKTTLPPRLSDDELIHYRSDNSKLYADTGFVAKYDVFDSLSEVLEEFRMKAASSKKEQS